MSIEAMNQMVMALEVEYRMYEATDPETGAPYNLIQAINAGRQAIAEAEKKEQKGNQLSCYCQNCEILGRELARIEKQEQGEPDVSSKLKFDCEFVDGTVADLTVYGSERDIKRLEARIKFWWNLEQHSGTPDSDKGERIIWGKPPQQRTWVDLTDDEMLMIYGQQHEGKKYSLGRMVQQALKDKNT